jgi:hypothetical protein
MSKIPDQPWKYQRRENTEAHVIDTRMSNPQPAPLLMEIPWLIWSIQGFYWKKMSLPLTDKQEETMPNGWKIKIFYIVRNVELKSGLKTASQYILI